MKTLTGFMVICMLVMGLAFLADPPSADARFRGGAAEAGTGQGPNFIDANNDGVCDWAQSRQAWDEATKGQYGAWVDANGDGVCDNYATRPQDGTGLGYRGGR